MLPRFSRRILAQMNLLEHGRYCIIPSAEPWTRGHDARLPPCSDGTLPERGRCRPGWEHSVSNLPLVPAQPPPFPSLSPSGASPHSTTPNPSTRLQLLLAMLAGPPPGKSRKACDQGQASTRSTQQHPLCSRKLFFMLHSKGSAACGEGQEGGPRDSPMTQPPRHANSVQTASAWERRMQACLVRPRPSPARKRASPWKALCVEEGGGYKAPCSLKSGRRMQLASMFRRRCSRCQGIAQSMSWGRRSAQRWCMHLRN